MHKSYDQRKSFAQGLHGCNETIYEHCLWWRFQGKGTWIGQVMASRPSLVTPSGRFEMQRSSKFPSVRYQGYRTSRTQEIQEGVNGARNQRGPTPNNR